MKCVISTAAALALNMLFGIASNLAVVQAQDRTPTCTTATATGTYGYRMTGVIVGFGPFLINGIYTHHADGTMDADVQLVVGNQSFPQQGTNGMFQINRDCTGSGKFAAPPLLPEVTYNFIVTDSGEQIELLNTNSGVVLQGISRRISKSGEVPACRNNMILGAYGYRLDGSLPGFSNVAVAGLITQKMEHPSDAFGTFTGNDDLNLMGQYFPRMLQGVFEVGSNCRGTGSYRDSLGNQINYVFTVVNGGDTLFLQGADAGTVVSGVAQRVR
jgi:hypothetical protein